MGLRSDEMDDRTYGSIGTGFGFSLKEQTFTFENDLEIETAEEAPSKDWQGGSARSERIQLELERPQGRWNTWLETERERERSENGDKRQLTVVGDDNRVVMDISLMEQFPARTVGKLVSPIGICTGTIVERNLVLSNRHCLGLSSSNTLPSDFFQRAYFEVVGGYKAKIAQVEWSGNHSDYSIWQLIEDVGNTTGWMSIEWTDFPKFQNKVFDLSYIGFSGDILKQTGLPSADFNCKSTQRLLNNDVFDSVVHLCDTYLGASGSAMLLGLSLEDGKLLKSTDPVIVGLNWGEFASGNLMLPTTVFKTAFEGAKRWPQPSEVTQSPGTSANTPYDNSTSSSLDAWHVILFVSIGGLLVAGFLAYKKRVRESNQHFRKPSEVKKTTLPPLPPPSGPGPNKKSPSNPASSMVASTLLSIPNRISQRVKDKTRENKPKEVRDLAAFMGPKKDSDEKNQRKPSTKPRTSKEAGQVQLDVSVQLNMETTAQNDGDIRRTGEEGQRKKKKKKGKVERSVRESGDCLSLPDSQSSGSGGQESVLDRFKTRKGSGQSKEAKQNELPPLPPPTDLPEL